jgi:hypothetical protein
VGSLAANSGPRERTVIIVNPIFILAQCWPRLVEVGAVVKVVHSGLAFFAAVNVGTHRSANVVTVATGRSHNIPIITPRHSQLQILLFCWVGFRNVISVGQVISNNPLPYSEKAMRLSLDITVRYRLPLPPELCLDIE